jgi:hypothetical protein
MKKLTILFFAILLAGCKPEQITVNNVVPSLTITPKTVMADGTTIIYVSATLNNLTDPDKLSVIFEASAGQFVKANDTLITQPATFINGLLTASVQLKVPLTTGTIHISARPLVTSATGDYIRRDSVAVTESAPASLMLTPSASFLKQNSASEILLTATLKNSHGNPVSTGHKVLFEDYTTANVPVHGTYRAARLITDASSTAVASYAQSTVPALGTFYIKCTYLDASGAKTAIKDSCLITVTN